mmetsp:Transcript_93614/g.302500  ORF Transcript_93614/g.302500 Transcript_93614/m.302500 type:complete len:221 (-) Transcript_93614:455-1117(-)
MRLYAPCLQALDSTSGVCSPSKTCTNQLDGMYRRLSRIQPCASVQVSRPAARLGWAERASVRSCCSQARAGWGRAHAHSQRKPDSHPHVREVVDHSGTFGTPSQADHRAQRTTPDHRECPAECFDHSLIARPRAFRPQEGQCCRQVTPAAPRRPPPPRILGRRSTRRRRTRPAAPVPQCPGPPRREPLRRPRVPSQGRGARSQPTSAWGAAPGPRRRACP